MPKLRDPETNKRLSRASPETERVTADAQHLAIIPPELWEAACARFEAMRGKSPASQRKKKFLLTGLLRCANCGAGMSMSGVCRNGRPRVRCTRHRESGDCPQSQTFFLDDIESVVLSGLKRELASPAAIEEFLRAYRAERERLAQSAGSERRKIERRLDEIDRELDRVTDCLARGIGSEARMDARAKNLTAEDARLRASLEALPSAPRRIEIAPDLTERYIREIASLENFITKRLADASSPAANLVRELIDSVMPHRPAPGELIVEMEGSLPVIQGEHMRNDVCVSLVPRSGRIRLLGFDTPESWRPRCASEELMAAMATLRTEMLVATRGTIMVREGLAHAYDGGKRKGWCVGK